MYPDGLQLSENFFAHLANLHGRLCGLYAIAEWIVGCLWHWVGASTEASWSCCDHCQFWFWCKHIEQTRGNRSWYPRAGKSLHLAQI